MSRGGRLRGTGRNRARHRRRAARTPRRGRRAGVARRPSLRGTSPRTSCSPSGAATSSTSRNSRGAILDAINYFEQAIARDPSFGHAHAKLADAYARLGAFPPTRTSERGVRYARGPRLGAPSALDNTIAEAHVALAHILFAFDFDWAASEREFRRAIALDPNYSFARGPLAICLTGQGRFAEAVAVLDTGRARDPLAALTINLLGRVHVVAGRPDDAIRTLQQALELNPQLDLAYQQLGHAYLQKGMNAEAITALRRAASLSGPRDSAQLAYAYAMTGRRAEAERVLRSLLASPRGGTGVASYYVAMAYAGLGDADAAFRWLDRGHAAGTSLVLLKVEPGFERLHGDPRWPKLLSRLGLPL